MKTSTLATALALAAATVASAATIDFGSLSAGDLANSAAPSGTLFSYAVLTQDTDTNPSSPTFGDPIPGSFSWQIDATAGSVLVQDPSVRGHGNGPIALDAVDQPVLLVFSSTINLVSFSGVLDHGSLSGGLPSQTLVFADGAGKSVGTLSLDYTQSGLSFSSGPVSGVKEIVLPSGRYVERLTYVATPEVNGQVLIGTLALAGAVALRRFKR